MFESTEWVLEEPDVNDNSKFDLVFPSIVKPKNVPADAVKKKFYTVFYLFDLLGNYGNRNCSSISV